MTDVNIRVDPQAMARILRDRNGPAARHLIRVGEEIKQEARQLVGVQTGNLRDRIVKRLGVGPRGNLAVYVGTVGVPYALWHHEGTQPHVIVPVKARRLVFYWPKAGKVIYAKSVRHPGTKPNRFLFNAMRNVMARHR